MGLPSTIVLASGNPGKLREIERLLAGLDVKIVPQSAYGVSDADETGTSFEENAEIKARHAAAATGLAAISDDSGLVVTALDGRPGVFSARYAGPAADDEANIDKLLHEMRNASTREAAFHCVACYVESSDAPAVFGRGEWRGEILDDRRGTSGFGYDPVFLDTELGRASAELSAEEKNARSHRGKALADLVTRLCTQ